MTNLVLYVLVWVPYLLCMIIIVPLWLFVYRRLNQHRTLCVFLFTFLFAPVKWPSFPQQGWKSTIDIYGPFSVCVFHPARKLIFTSGTLISIIAVGILA